jgi:hypothetical protein
MEELSTSAQRWLNFFTQNPDLPLNYLTLMSMDVSRARSVAILKELKEFGFVSVIKRIGGGSSLKLARNGASNTVGSGASNTVGSGYSYTASSAISNNYTASKVNKATNKFLDPVEGEENKMGDDWFDRTYGSSDDLARDRKRHMEQKKAEYTEAREVKAAQRKDKHRSNIDPVSWTCKDVAYEFSDRMANIWSIKPFSVTQSRFVQALAVFRKQHDTDGALELAIVDLFFSTLQHDKYTDGNHLWRAFLYKAPSLIQTARERTISVEQRETDIIKDQELTSKKLSLLDEDDDV